MTDEEQGPGTSPGSDAPATSEAAGAPAPVGTEDVAHLVAERDALAAELQARGAPKRRVRRATVAVLVGLSCLLVLLSVLVTWTHRTVLNTDAFVNTVGPVFENPGVDQAVATYATNQLFEQLHLEARLHEALPKRIAFAAAPITTATKGVVTDQVAKVVGSPKFQTLWKATLGNTQRQVVAALRGQHSELLSTSNGVVVLNTVPLINHALAETSGTISNLIGHKVTLPTITSAELPQSAVDKLNKALGINLPSNFGQIALIHSKNLSTAQKGVKAFDGIAIILPILTLLVIALALWLSLNRQRTLVRMSAGVLLLMVILRRVVLHFEGEVVAKANNPSVAQSVLGDLLHGFFLLTAWILGIAGVVFVVALLAGPYRWAVWLRAQVGRGLHAVAQLANRERRGHALAWMGAHSEPLQLAGAAVAFILFLVISISWISFVVIGVLLVIYELFLARLKPHDQGASPDRPANRGVGEPAPH